MLQTVMQLSFRFWGGFFWLSFFFLVGLLEHCLFIKNCLSTQQLVLDFILSHNHMLIPNVSSLSIFSKV